MNYGNHGKKRSLRWRRKPALMLLSLILLLGLAVGGTIAYLFTSDGPMKNTFTPNQAPNQVVEDLDDGVKNNVRIQNISKIDTYIRAAVLVNWKDDDGDVYGVAPKENEDYTITWCGTNDGTWAEADGYYYYLERVSPDESTGALFTACEVEENKAPTGYYLSVEIVAQSIQADGTDSDGKHPVTLAWGEDITIGEDGELSVMAD